MGGFLRVVWASAVVVALVACRTIPATREAPAVITDPTPESRAALAKAVSAALNGAHVKLADDALTKTDTLIIEHEQPRDPTGAPPDGRQRGMPEQFRLVKAGAQCSLVHQRTDKRYPLTGVTCSLL
jgi:hypothetical protein